MKRRWFVVAVLISLGVFVSAASGSAAASAPSCPGSVNGDPLSGPSNVGSPGVWLQGDPQVAGILDCTYHQYPDGSGQQYDVHLAWVTAKSADPALYGCGQTPTDPTTTFVSAKFWAYAGINFAAAPPLFAAAAKALLAEVENGLAKPCASTAKPPAAQLPNSVVATPEYRAFLGLNDPTTAQAACVGRRQQRANDLVSRAGSFVGVTSKVSIPSENSFGVHSNNLLWPGNDLYTLLAKSDWPSRLRPGNVYANATAPYEGALRAAIVGSEGNLQPADVLYYALKVTNGSYPLAVLTAHNLLKQVAFEGRDAIDTKAGPKLVPKAIAELQAATAVVAKLGSLRCTPAKSRDKIGPWYHEFAVLSAGALVSPGTAGLVVFGEHLGKAAKTAVTKVRNTLPAVLKKELDKHGPADFFKGEGGFDGEKYALDNIAADAAETFTISKLSR